ncbi:MAG: 16S rRNA (adenine(1518)-N(6)/adenine(1519)-N(6))-dimethyltransferase RsmA [Halobacteria archaeon]
MRIKGQHFLKDERVLKRIVEYAQVGEGDVILEIGAGKGNLTRALAEKAKQVYAIELDKKLASDLRAKFAGTNVEVIQGNALKLDFPYFNKVVSNIPYYISSDLTFKLLRYKFELGVLMYQKEFAERMTAMPGDKNYGRLSITAQHYAEIEILEIVPRSAFTPVPEVDSAIVRLKLRKPSYEVKNEEFFLKLVSTCFSQRRKKLKNAILKAASSLELNQLALEEVVKEGSQWNKRAEELSPAEFALLANELIKYRNRKIDI